MTGPTWKQGPRGESQPVVDYRADPLTPAVLANHQPKFSRIKPWGAWQVKCAGCRFVGPQHMSKTAAETPFTLHLAAIEGIIR